MELIEKHLEVLQGKASPEQLQWFKKALQEVADAARDAEFDRLVKTLHKERPLLCRYNNFDEILRRA